jgi:hypothetical protein
MLSEVEASLIFENDYTRHTERFFDSAEFTLSERSESNGLRSE